MARKNNTGNIIKNWETFNAILSHFCETTNLFYKSTKNLVKLVTLLGAVASIFFHTQLNSVITLLIEIIKK